MKPLLFIFILALCFIYFLFQAQDKPVSFTASEEAHKKADAEAQKIGDDRPYPKGWRWLPRNPDPKIADSIKLAQTPAEVIAVMGQAGASQNATREELLQLLQKYYERAEPSYAMPKKFDQIENILLPKGHYFYWKYQGFPSTADWIVVAFQADHRIPDSKAQVIGKGVFRLGDY
jgi:hypothetical protein